MAVTDKPPERAEWENWIDVYGAAAWSAGRRRSPVTDDEDLITTREQLRAAVQRALDEREAATWQKIHSESNAYDDIYDHPFWRWFCEELAAAEARAKGNDGESTD